MTESKVEYIALVVVQLKLKAMMCNISRMVVSRIGIQDLIYRIIVVSSVLKICLFIVVLLFIFVVVLFDVRVSIFIESHQ